MFLSLNNLNDYSYPAMRILLFRRDFYPPYDDSIISRFRPRAINRGPPIVSLDLTGCDPRTACFEYKQLKRFLETRVNRVNPFDVTHVSFVQEIRRNKENGGKMAAVVRSDTF